MWRLLQRGRGKHEPDIRARSQLLWDGFFSRTKRRGRSIHRSHRRLPRHDVQVKGHSCDPRSRWVWRKWRNRGDLWEKKRRCRWNQQPHDAHVADAGASDMPTSAFRAQNNLKKKNKKLTFKNSNHHCDNRTFAAVILIYCWLQVIMITELPNHRKRIRKKWTFIIIQSWHI